MVSVNSTLLWALADSLGVELTYDNKLHRIRGEGTFQVDFFGLPVNFHSRVVSSHALKDKSVLLLVKVKGNFCLLAHAEPGRPYEKVTIHFVNLAKMNDKIEGWLEMHKPKTAAECEQLLRGAINASFQKKTKKTWHQI